LTVFAVLLSNVRKFRQRFGLLQKAACNIVEVLNTAASIEQRRGNNLVEAIHQQVELLSDLDRGNLRTVWLGEE